MFTPVAVLSPARVYILLSCSIMKTLRSNKLYWISNTTTEQIVKVKHWLRQRCFIKSAKPTVQFSDTNVPLSSYTLSS